MTYYFIIFFILILLFILFLINVRKSFINSTKKQVKIQNELNFMKNIKKNNVKKPAENKDPNIFTQASNKMILDHILNDHLLDQKKIEPKFDKVKGFDESPDLYNINNPKSDGTYNLNQNVSQNVYKTLQKAFGPVKETKHPEIYVVSEPLESCQVPTLNTEQCYKSRNYECPVVNGTHLQCTNNYIPLPTEYNADCGNRTFDMVPYPWKISENCYYNKVGFNREKKYDKVKFV